MFAAGFVGSQEEVDSLVDGVNLLWLDCRGVPYFLNLSFDSVPTSFRKKCEKIIYNWTTCVFPNYSYGDDAMNKKSKKVIKKVFQPNMIPRRRTFPKLLDEKIFEDMNYQWEMNKLVVARGDVISFYIQDVKQKYDLFNQLKKLPKLRSMSYSVDGLTWDEFEKPIRDEWIPSFLLNLKTLTNLVDLSVYIPGNIGAPYSFTPPVTDETDDLEYDTNHLAEGLPHLTKLRKLDLNLKMKYFRNAHGTKFYVFSLYLYLYQNIDSSSSLLFSSLI